MKTTTSTTEHPTIEKKGNISVITGKMLVTFTNENFETQTVFLDGTKQEVLTLGDKTIIVNVFNGQMLNYLIK